MCCLFNEVSKMMLENRRQIKMLILNVGNETAKMQVTVTNKLSLSLCLSLSKERLGDWDGQMDG